MWPLELLIILLETVWAWANVIALVTLIVVSLRAYKSWKNDNLRKEWDWAGKDVVVLHTFGRGYTCPHISPFGLKLETYLRMAGFTVKIDDENPMSHKDKSPWITINSVDLADSQLIIDYLSSNYKNLNSHLTDMQKATASAFQIMADEHLYWGLVRWRYLTDPDVRAMDLTNVYPTWVKYMLPLLKHMLRKALHAQGIGRHTDAEVLSLMRKDMESISTYLGEKPFLMGDEPSEVDCAMFGQLGQLLWNSPDSPYYLMMTDDYPNLQKYCLRMKERFWPDWDQILDKPTK